MSPPQRIGHRRIRRYRRKEERLTSPPTWLLLLGLLRHWRMTLQPLAPSSVAQSLRGQRASLTPTIADDSASTSMSASASTLQRKDSPSHIAPISLRIPHSAVTGSTSPKGDQTLLSPQTPTTTNLTPTTPTTHSPLCQYSIVSAGRLVTNHRTRGVRQGELF